MEQEIVKSSGNKVKFSFSKLRKSLYKSGANDTMVTAILDEIKNELYEGISTRELHNRALALLKKYKGAYASRYNLKKAIYGMGPSGFPFEKLVAELLKITGYRVYLNRIIPGKCISHEVDIEALDDRGRHFIECKFHSEEGRNCDVKVPLYINSRFVDLSLHEKAGYKTFGWVVTNTRFTLDALNYGECVGLKLLSWDYPESKSLKDLIDNSGTYPVTASTLLFKEEKKFLLDREIILGRHLLDKSYLLDHQGITGDRKQRILTEFRMLCNISENAEK